MHPITGEGLAGGGLALGYLVFMMGEHKVLTARMDIEGGTQKLHAHGAALDMPAGPAFAPGAIPRGLAGLRALPEGEVKGVLLVLGGVDAGAALQILDGLSGQLAVAGEGADGEVNVAIVGGVRMALFDEGLHQRDYLGDVLGSAGVAGGPLYGKGVCVGIVFLNIALRDLGHGDALFVCLSDELVVYVGKVLNKLYLITPVFKIPAKGIEYHEGAGVADVEEVVYGGAAYVHADLAGYQGNELLLFAGHGVVYLHR